MLPVREEASMNRLRLFVLAALLAASAVPAVAGEPPADATPARTVLWDGEKVAVGVGWVSPTGAGNSVEVREKDARSKPHAATFRFARPETFVEGGWQWAPWYPAPSGTDVTPYATLEVAVKVDGPKPPGDLLLSLAAPGDHNTTGRVSLKKYAPDLFDGRWHPLRIPLADLYAADRADIGKRFPKSKFDPAHVVQVILGAWNGPGGEFTVSVDDLALVRPAK